MRGLIESSSIARVIRAPLWKRGYATGRGSGGGIGRGRGRGNFGETEELIFNDSSSSSSYISQGHGRGASGRGGGPLLPNISLGRGQGPAPSDSKAPAVGLANNTSGFGRGKPLNDTSSPAEDILSSERSSVLPKWSKWDEKLQNADPRETASPAELRLLGDEAPTSILRPLPGVQQLRNPVVKGWQQTIQQPVSKTTYQGPQPGWQQPYPGQASAGTPAAVAGSTAGYYSPTGYYDGNTSQSGSEGLYEHTPSYGVSEQQPEYIASGATYTVQPGLENSYAYNQETGQASGYSTNQEIPIEYQSGDWGYNASASGTYEQPSAPNEGQYPYENGGVEPVHSAYEWGQTAAQLAVHVKGQADPKTPVNAELDYEARIEECFKQGKLKEVDSIYGEMKSSQVRASAKTYGTLIQAYIQMNQMDKVPQVYQEMSGIIADSGKPKEASPLNAEPTVSEPTSTFHAGEYTPVEASPVQAGQMGLHGEEFRAMGDYSNNYYQAGHPDMGFSPSGGQVPTTGLGMGRGKKVENIFNFDFSRTTSFGSHTGYGMRNTQVNMETQPGAIADDYSQTFKPVIQPGWHAFAPQGVSVGPGAGRGRSSLPQTAGSGIGSGTLFSSEQIDSATETSRSSYSQRMGAALQRASAPKPREAFADTQYDYPEEPSQPSLSQQEAGERAMSILNARMSRRYSRLEDWSRDENDEDPKVRKRSSAQLARVSRQRRDPRKEMEELEAKRAAEVASKLTDEEAKEEAERLKAFEENKAIQALFDTFTEFMKCYGEMALEPEHELGDFTNPDIDEKPMMPFDEYLQKAKPNIMKTGLYRSEEEWQKTYTEALKLAPYYEEFAERYAGPGRYTAKQENEDLEEIASALPSDVGAGPQNFVQRSLTTLKSNPGFNLDEKQWMLAAMVDEFSQYSVSS